MSDQDTNEIWTEKTIQNGRAGIYDVQEGEDVCRYITDWYLTRLKSPLHRRCPMPSRPEDLLSQQETNDKYVLYGRLLAKSPGGSDVRFRLEDFKMWAIDRSHRLRGIWVRSKEAWYMLQKPLPEKPQFNVKVISSEYLGEIQREEPLLASLPDQSIANVELRAKFGLVSNLTDIFLFDEGNPESQALMKKHSKKSASQVYDSLKPTEGMLARYPGRAREPFDLRLLKRYPDFVKDHLGGFHPDFKLNCPFMKSLRNPSKTTFTDSEFETSALAAETRGGRKQWGALCQGEERIDPNWVLAAKLEDAAKKRKSRKEEKRPRKKILLVAVPENRELPNVDTTEQCTHHEGHCEPSGRRPLEEVQAVESSPPRADEETAERHVRGERNLQDRGTFDATIYSQQRMEESLHEIWDFLEPDSVMPLSASLAGVRDACFKFSSPESVVAILPQIRENRIRTWEHKLLLVLVLARTCELENDDSARIFGKKLFLQEKLSDHLCGAGIIFETWKDEAIRRIEDLNQENPMESILFDYLCAVVNLMLAMMSKPKLIGNARMLGFLKHRREIYWDEGLHQISAVSSRAIDYQHTSLQDAVISARNRMKVISLIGEQLAVEVAPEAASQLENQSGQHTTDVQRDVERLNAERKNNASERRREKLNQSLIAKRSSNPQPSNSSLIDRQTPPPVDSLRDSSAGSRNCATASSGPCWVDSKKSTTWGSAVSKWGTGNPTIIPQPPVDASTMTPGCSSAPAAVCDSLQQPLPLTNETLRQALECLRSTKAYVPGQDVVPSFGGHAEPKDHYDRNGRPGQKAEYGYNNLQSQGEKVGSPRNQLSSYERKKQS